MKHCLLILLLELCSTAWVFSQGTLREFIVEKDDNPQVFYKGQGCTPNDGVIVFYTTIPDLKFSMPDTPNRLKRVSPFDKENNCYVLCIQPTDTRIGGIMQYSIAITGNNFKPMPAVMVSGIQARTVQYFKIKIEEDWKSAFESLRQEIAELRGQNSDVTKSSDEQNMITDIQIVEKVVEKEPELTDSGDNQLGDAIMNPDEQVVDQVIEIMSNDNKRHNGEVYNPNGIKVVYVEGNDSIPDFYIGKYEVTQAQWKSIMGKNPRKSLKGDLLPVQHISWNKVQEFIVNLNKQTGKEYRLPTEVEWEYAARGGKESRNYVYSGSNNPDDVAWYASKNQRGRPVAIYPHPVGTKLPNELGIHDMSGNVWEWCADDHGKSHWFRGGASNQSEQNCLPTSCRYGPNSFYRSTFIGFRLVLVP